MTRRSLVAKSNPLGVVHLLTTLWEGPAQGVHIVLVVDVLAAMGKAQGVHIVLVVDVLAAPLQTGAILLPRL